MPAYLIVMREGPLTDPAEYEEYQRLAKEAAPPGPMKALSVYGALTVLEGTPPDGVVILEFPSVEEAKAWYQSPGYQKAVPHRIASGDWRAVILEGL